MCPRVEVMKAGADAMRKVTTKVMLCIPLLLFAEFSRGTPPRAKEDNMKDWHNDLQLITYVIVGALMINTAFKRYKKLSINK